MDPRILTIIVSLLMVSPSFAAPQKILSCESQHSPFDPDFVQGSELFGGVFYDDENGKASFEISSMEKPKSKIYKMEESTKTVFSIEQSTGFFEWIVNGEEDYASLVFLGAGWGFVIEVSENHPNSDWAGMEFEMMCDETEHFELVLK